MGFLPFNLQLPWCFLFVISDFGLSYPVEKVTATDVQGCRDVQTLLPLLYPVVFGKKKTAVDLDSGLILSGLTGAVLWNINCNHP